MPGYITDYIETFSDSHREGSDEKILMKKILMYRMHLFLYLKHFESFWVIHKMLIW